MSIPNDMVWPFVQSADKSFEAGRRQMFNVSPNNGSRMPSPYAQMPIPTGAPWNMSDMSWASTAPHPDVVNFTGESKVTIPSRNPRTKRKSQLEIYHPPKQHITEEKMAAQLNGMHISLDYVPTATSFDYYEDDDDKDDLKMSIEERLKSAQQVILSEEIERLQDEPLIPKALLERLEKPCMSLIPWKPSPLQDDEPKPSTSSDNNNNPEEMDNEQPTMDIEM